MAQQIYIGNFPRGIVANRKQWNIDNDSFPFLWNAYEWRGRIKRKRGTEQLGQLAIQVQSVASAPAPFQIGPIMTLDGSGNGSANLITLASATSSATIDPNSINFSDGTNVYKEPTTPNGTLVGTPAGTGTINYVSGAITISGGAHGATVISNVATSPVAFSYFPGNPVMGLRDFVFIPNISQPAGSADYPFLLAFDTTNAYEITQAGMPDFYNVSFYKQSQNPFVWSAPDTNLFWTTNYEYALWATNNKPGFHFMPLDGGVDVTAASPTTATITLTGNGLVMNDLVWINEVTGAIATGTGATQNANINWQTGYVSTTGTPTFTATFDGTMGSSKANFTPGATGSGGIAQFITKSIAGQDGIKWYDGDPTSANGIPNTTGLGWSNFAPPLTLAGSQIIADFSSGTQPFYLVGALAIVAFKDRLVFFSPYIQTSKANSAPIQLIDTALWSWNGTPYYSANTPKGLGFDRRAYVQDQTGLGGNLPAGIFKPIISVMNNEDVILVGFGGTGRKTRFVYTNNDYQPFLWYTINSELPSNSTFSGIVLDKGGIDIGAYGLTLTDQQSCQRIDLDIPDAIFDIQSINSGNLRVNAVRDFPNEWIYFCFPVGASQWKYPTQSLLYNYREQTWGLLYENFTAHGTYRLNPAQQYTWATIPYPTWEDWLEPWGSGASASLYPSVIAGNPQGYVLIKDKGMGEAQSGTIYAITGDGFGNTQITSINHCVDPPDTVTADPNLGLSDYLFFTGVLGLASTTITAIAIGFPTVISTVNTYAIGSLVQISGIVGTTELNGNTYRVIAASGGSITIGVQTTNVYVSGGTVASVFNGQIGMVTATPDANTFIVDIPTPVFGANGYLGLGTFARLSQPLIQTKAFNPYWDQGRQCRLSTQKYLLDGTQIGQVSVNIYLSQDPTDAWNSPVENVPGNASPLVYSQLMFTCPETGGTNVNNASVGQLGNGVATTLPLNIPYPVAPGSVSVKVGSLATFTDNGTGGFTVTGTGISAGSSVSYTSGLITMVFSVAPLNVASIVSYNSSTTNLQMPYATPPNAIWHRFNTSMIGDSVQVGITLNDAQMRNLQIATSDIVLHGIHLTVDKAGHLA